MCFGGTGDIGPILERVPEGETLQSFEVRTGSLMMDDKLLDQDLRLGGGHSDT
jgi:hypothetical protein